MARSSAGDFGVASRRAGDGGAAVPPEGQLFSGAFGEPFERARYAAAAPFARVPDLAHAAALAAAGGPATVHVRPGRHDWAFWRAELPEALAALGTAIG